jgi:threonine dehydrogenase-like Zn-dependent dehydrogenase
MLNIKGGHCSGDRGYRAAIDMLARGVMPVSEIVNYSLPMDEIVAGLSMVSSPTDSVKVTVDPALRG